MIVFFVPNHHCWKSRKRHLAIRLSIKIAPRVRQSMSIVAAPVGAILKLRVKLVSVLSVLLLFGWAGLVAQTGATKSGAKSPPPKKMASNAPQKSSSVKAKTVTSNAPKSTATATHAAKQTLNSKAPSKASTQAKSQTQMKSNAPASSYAKNRKNVHTAPVRYSAQNEPTPDRYREIQQALKEKGYLQGEANGKWDTTSTEAMRRFQQDQNLEASGKLDSLSLIALGLGPKRTAGAQARP
jgi:hypothetical protein